MDNRPQFKIVLCQPQIPGNTGTIGRTCVALNLELILIHPLGFDLSEKAVRRAGLDYWKYARIKEYQNFDEFIATERPDSRDLIFFENNTQTSYYDAPYSSNSYLIFGSEIVGIPSDIREKYPDSFYELPMYSDKIRSLNLSNTVTAAAFECIRHLNYP